VCCASQLLSHCCVVLRCRPGWQGKRRSLPNARIMIHQPLGGAQGQAADIEIQAKEILFVRSLLNSYISEYTGQPIEKIQVTTWGDRRLTAAGMCSCHLSGWPPMAI
jgi:ATP-dependent Clp endopeptidase proteolytic subunit ClpP